MTTMRCCVAWLVVMFSLLGRSMAQQHPDLLRVDEPKIRLHLLPKSELELPLINTSGRSLDGNVQLDFLYGDNGIHRQERIPFHQEPGSTITKVACDLQQLSYRTPTRLGWYRLRYLLTPKVAGDFPPVQGVVQLGP